VKLVGALIGLGMVLAVAVVVLCAVVTVASGR
jgi:hypothetical protein